MKTRKQLKDYTMSEFIFLINEIIDAQGGEQHQDQLLEHFIEITQHPNGSDLIYYPERPGDDTPENIVKIVKEWRASQGLPGFKEA